MCDVLWPMCGVSVCVVCIPGVVCASCIVCDMCVVSVINMLRELRLHVCGGDGVGRAVCAVSACTLCVKGAVRIVSIACDVCIVCASGIGLFDGGCFRKQIDETSMCWVVCVLLCWDCVCEVLCVVP